MKTDEIRDSFLEFFRKKNHTVVPSDSLVPQNDPTLLFTGAGMNQFKEYFLGLKKDLTRAASSQKCLRTGDLDEVGRTPYHHSFFEMLGNFSFGDYFKEEAIRWAWEYLTVNLKIPKERLRISVHKADDEAFRIWRDKIKIREDWIAQGGDKSNFWPANAPAAGPNGPCGPCSEVYYDQDPDSHSEDIAGPGFAEIWNLVFTQFDRQEGGRLISLVQKNIDTGMGLERLACVLQGKKTNFEIDIFEPLTAVIKRYLNVDRAAPDTAALRQIYTIADHLRAIVFAITDGVIPSNEKRGYVVRKLIRRAVWNAQQIMNPLLRRIETPFLWTFVPEVVKVMSPAYGELKNMHEGVANILKAEEERFIATLESGSQILGLRLQEFEQKKTGMVLPAEVVFELYDTYGFPDDLTQTVCAKRGYQIDQAGFDRLMEKQRKKAKEASPIVSSIFVSSDLEKKLAALPPSSFLGYQTLEAEGKVLFVEMQADEGLVVLDQTPFYGESGGQVGDRGIFISRGGSRTAPTFTARVVDTQKKENLILHAIKIEQGSVKAGDRVTVRVDKGRRECAMRNHTATHLLHAALREILGKQVRQLGSLVSPEKLRFDYSYSEPPGQEKIKRIEDLVNQQILADIPVAKEEKPIEDAKKEGAVSFFGEKYGSRVRVVAVPGVSKEFCGGTHCGRTGQIGFFVITSDAAIASGTRRIEALTGEGAIEYVRGIRSQVSQLARALKTPPAELQARVAKLQESVKRLEKQALKAGAAKADAGPAKEKRVGDYHFVAQTFRDLDLNHLRAQSDELRSGRIRTIYFLGSEKEDKIHFILGLSHDLVKGALDIRDLGKRVSDILSGASGGRPDLVQGGAPNKGQFQNGLDSVLRAAIDYLKTQN